MSAYEDLIAKADASFGKNKTQSSSQQTQVQQSSNNASQNNQSAYDMLIARANASFKRDVDMPQASSTPTTSPASDVQTWGSKPESEWVTEKAPSTSWGTTTLRATQPKQETETEKRIKELQAQLAEIKQNSAYDLTGSHDWASDRKKVEDELRSLENTKSWETVDKGTLALGAAEQGAGQIVGGFANTLNMILGGPAQEIHTMLNQTASDLGIGKDDKNLFGDTNYITRFANWVNRKNKQEAEYFAKNAEGNKAAENINKYGTMVAAAVPQAVLAFGTGGTSLATTEGLQSIAAANSAGSLGYISEMAGQALRSMAKDPQTQLSFVQEAGGAYQNALDEGATESEAALYSMLYGSLASLVEVGGADEALGGMQKLPKNVQKALANGKVKPVLEYIKSIVSEVGEENVQGVLERGLKSTYTDVPIFGTGDTNAIINPTQMGEEAKGAAIVSTLLGGGQTAVAGIINNAANSAVPENYANKPLTEADLADYMEVGQRRHVRNGKSEMLSSGNSPILTTVEQIKNFISSALNGNQQDVIKAYGKVGDRMAEDISLASSGQTDIHGYYLELDGNRINHMADHVETDADKRNVPLKQSEAENITSYIDNYDAVLDVINRKDGQTRVTLCKDVGDGNVVVVELVSKGRNSLQPVTAWKNSYEAFKAAWANKNEAYYTSHRALNVPARGYQQTSSELNIPQSTAAVNRNDAAESKATPAETVQQIINDATRPKAPSVAEQIVNDAINGVPPTAAQNATGVQAQQGDITTAPTQQNASMDAPVELNSQQNNGNQQQTANAQQVGEKERGFSENIRTDENMEQAIRDEYESDPDYYKQKSNAETLQKAQDIYSQGAEYAETTVREALAAAKAGKKLAPEMIPLARMVANDMARAGRVDAARSILSDAAAELTEAGQLGQAARILRDADPVSKAKTIQKLVDKLNDNLTRWQKRDNIKNGRGTDKGRIKVDKALVDEYVNATDDAARDAALDKIEQNIADQLPSTFKDKFTALRYLNMLGNFKTQIRNVGGNAVFGLTTAAKRRVQAVSELIASVVSGGKYERTTSLFTSRSLRKEARADFENYVDEAKGEGKYTDAGRTAQKGIEDKRKIFTGLLTPLEWSRKATNWAMDAGDVIFLRFHYADSLAGWLQAHGIKSMADATPEQLKSAREFAIKEAQEATFRDNNAVSDWVNTFDKGWDEKGWVGKAAQKVTQGIVPFRKTPANVAVRAVEYSPFGVAETIVKSVQAANGKATGADVINSLSKNLVGTTLLAAGYVLSNMGLVRGGEDDDKLDEFQKMQGQMDYSVKIGDTYVSLSQLAPSAIPFFVGAKLEEMISNGDGNFSTEDISKLFGAISQPMLEMSMLSGVNDALNNLSNFSGSTDALPKFLTNSIISYLSQGVSNTLLGQFEQASEENRQTNYSTKDSVLGSDAQYTLGKFMAKVPGLDYNQQDYVDAWGRTQSNGSALERTWNAFFNPTYASDDRSTAVDKELERLYNDNKDDEGFPNVFPQKASRSMTYGDGKVMTPDEYLQYSKDRGQKSLELVSQFINSKEYQTLDDKTRAEIIKNLYNFAADRALKTVKDSNGVEYKGDWDKVGALRPSEQAQFIATDVSYKEAKKTGDYDLIDDIINGKFGRLSSKAQEALGDNGAEMAKINEAMDNGLSTSGNYFKAQDAMRGNDSDKAVDEIKAMSMILPDRDVDAMAPQKLSEAQLSYYKVLRSADYSPADFSTIYGASLSGSGNITQAALRQALESADKLSYGQKQEIWSIYAKSKNWEAKKY